MSQFEYIKLFWEHELNHEPVVILYEVNLDNERLALRSIDIFADRSVKKIDNLYEGVIELVPIPTVEELNSHVWGNEFYACFMSKLEFETIWKDCFYTGDLKMTE